MSLTFRMKGRDEDKFFMVSERPSVRQFVIVFFWHIFPRWINGFLLNLHQVRILCNMKEYLKSVGEKRNCVECKNNNADFIFMIQRL